MLSLIVGILGCAPQSATPTAVSSRPNLVGPSQPSTAAGLVDIAPTQAARQFDPALFSLSLDPVTTSVRQPVQVTSAFDGSGRLFVVERAGRIRILRNGSLVERPFLDIQSLVGSRGSEQGLLGLAFHPRYRENGFFYVNYTDRNGDTVIARYTVSSDHDLADPGSPLTMFNIPQPAPNHNGGNLVFGPDGLLYIGLGDGGGGGDQFRNAQNLQALLGKMLRVDVDSGSPYGVPPDNPFVGRSDVRPEIWGYGLRNPWRYSFDRATGDLYIADVGQNRLEEVHFVPAGSPGGLNFGWPMMEGLACFPANAPCDPTGLEIPIGQYGRDSGCSITGGYVYRGSAYPPAQGAYYFGDFCSGRIWSLDWTAEAGWREAELTQVRLGISSFGEDELGELYLTSLDPGGVYHLRFESR